MRKINGADQFQVLISLGTQRTWCSVILKHYRADAVLITRLGHVPLDVPRRALDGVPDERAAALLIVLLAERLAALTGLEEPSASPSGDHGGPGWSQPTLNLDLSS